MTNPMATVIELNISKDELTEKEINFIKSLLKSGYQDKGDVNYYCTEKMTNSEYSMAKSILLNVYHKQMDLGFIKQEQKWIIDTIYDFIIKKEQQREELKQKQIEEEKSDPTRFFDKKKFIPTRVEEEIEAENDIIFVNDVDFHLYTGKYWRKAHINEIGKMVKDKLKETATPSHIKNVTQLIEKEKQLDVDKVNRNRNRLVLQNGTLDITNWSNIKFIPDTYYKEDYSTIQLNCNFDEEAQCPNFHKYLYNIFEGDNERINLVGEMLGYCLVPSAKHEKGFMLYGSGANGKSVLLKVITNLLTEENISNVDLSDFEKAFNRSALHNKLANITDEMEGKVKDSGFYKRIVSGNSIGAEFKFRDSFTFKPFCTLIFAMNNFPTINDKTHGLYRKMIMIPFDVTIKEEDQDKDLGDKLKRELDGILQFALRGLKRLHEQNKFTHSVKGTKLLEEFRKNCNPVEVFFEETIIENGDGKINCKELYDLYRNFCNEEGFKGIMNNINFGKEVSKKFSNVERKKITVEGKRLYHYIGIELSY